MLREDQNYLAEMATLGPKDHKLGIDIKIHIYQPGRAERLSHGPRVKCFKPNTSSDFSITLNVDPNKMYLVGSYDKILSTKDFNKLFGLIKKYRIPLLNMWWDAYMTSSELRGEMDEIDLGVEVEQKGY